MQTHRYPKPYKKPPDKTWDEVREERNIKLEKYRAENKSNPTPSENEFESILHSLRDRYHLKWQKQRPFQRPKFPNSFYLIDFYIKYPYKIAFEIDGASHNNKKAYDYQRDMDMMNAGLLVVRITNDQIRYDRESVVSIVKETLDNRLAINGKGKHKS